MKNSLKDQIISQDKFGTSINFQFNKNESHKTIFGGIVSILLNLLSLYIILLFG